MMCGSMRLATLQFEVKLQKCITMWITIFNIFIREGILSDIHSEISFLAPPMRLRKTQFPTVYPTTLSPNENFEYNYLLFISTLDCLEIRPLQLAYKFIPLTHFSRMNFPICINWTSLFPILGLYFIFHFSI